MWLVLLRDVETSEEYEVVAFDFSELMDILVYIKTKGDSLELLNVEQRWLCCGLDGLKQCLGEGNEKKN